MDPDRSRRLDADLQALCDALLPKLPHAPHAMHYAHHGEWWLALEMLSDWCVDSHPLVSLSAAELMRFVAIGESMGLRRPWADLLPLVQGQEAESLPLEYAVMAREYLHKEVRANPIREAWLLRVEAAVFRIGAAHRTP